MLEIKVICPCGVQYKAISKCETVLMIAKAKCLEYETSIYTANGGFSCHRIITGKKTETQFSLAKNKKNNNYQITLLIHNLKLILS